MDRLLIDYLPNVLKPVRELQAIMSTEQVEVSLSWDSVDDTLNDQFVETATDNGVSRWEKILNIIPKATEALDTRRFRILTRLNAQLPYTMSTLQQQLEALCGANGYSVSLQHNDYLLIVKVNLVAKDNFDDVKLLLERVVPANMITDLALKYNQYLTLAEFTHRNLARYTHYQLRNEVIENGE